MSGAGRAPYVYTRACARAYVRARARTHAHNHIRINQHVRAVSFSPLFISYPCFPSPIFFVPLSPAHHTHPFVTTHTHTHTHTFFTTHTPCLHTTHPLFTPHTQCLPSAGAWAQRWTCARYLVMPCPFAAVFSPHCTHTHTRPGQDAFVVS